jgi:hypothetical protein
MFSLLLELLDCEFVPVTRVVGSERVGGIAGDAITRGSDNVT